MVKTLKIFFSGTQKPMTLKICLLHRVLEYYQICSNDDHGLTLTYFMEGQIRSPVLLYRKKVKTMDFSETIIVYDIKVGRCSQLNEYMKLHEYQRLKPFIDHGPNLSDSIFLNFFSSITNWPIEAKFHVEPPWDGGMKACSNDLGHMTKMATMPIYGKTFNNLLLWNQKADDFENWYTTLSTRVLPSLLKWCPWADLHLFYSKVSVGPLCFCMGKKLKQCIFFRNYCSLWYKSW